MPPRAIKGNGAAGIIKENWCPTPVSLKGRRPIRTIKRNKEEWGFSAPIAKKWCRDRRGDNNHITVNKINKYELDMAQIIRYGADY